MKAIDIPDKFNIPFANSAAGSFINDIPEASQIGIVDGRASLTTGFPPLNFSPTGAGGVPPFGADFNGLFFQDTSWARWLSAGGAVPYDSTFATAIGGYPNGAIIPSAVTAGLYWRCTADDNTTNPDAGTRANWVPFRPTMTKLLSSGTNVTYGIANVGVETVRSNSGSAMIDTLPGTSPGILPNGSLVTIVNGDASAMLAVSAGAGATLNGATFIYVGPHQSITFLCDGTGYWPVESTIRAKMAAATSIFVATTGNDSTNHGLTPGSPFLTLQAAWNMAQRILDLGGNTLTFQMADGTYTTQLIASGQIVGQVDVDGGTSFGGTVTPGVKIIGNTGTPANVVIDIAVDDASCILSANGASIYLNGLRFVSSATGGDAISCEGGARIWFENVDFNYVDNYHIRARDPGSEINILGDYEISDDF